VSNQTIHKSSPEIAADETPALFSSIKFNAQIQPEKPAFPADFHSAKISGWFGFPCV
jgi:hypothetical protein